MPIYEYRCSSCGHETEALQKLSDAPLKTCPACGKDSFSKLISAAGFQLKGSGWYATDFKGSKPAAAKDKDGAMDKDGAKDKESPKDKGDTAAKPDKDAGAKSESKAEAAAGAAGART